MTFWSLCEFTKCGIVRLTLLTLGVSVMLGYGETATAGDIEAGKQVFKKCAACHKLEAGKNGVGPSLHGVVGRAAGSAPGFRYSNGLQSAGFAWTAEKLQHWLSNPRKMVPGTKMAFPGLPSEKDRENVIEFLAASSR